MMVKQIIAICDACKKIGSVKIAVGEFKTTHDGLLWNDVCCEHFENARKLGSVTRLYDTLGDANMRI
jgi:hypothetical protein